ncbi:hypothetical protein I4U23_020900 [Adineta vaga]|nr:hypothetical protein I4U23_020900 [Adineta vaga]
MSSNTLTSTAKFEQMTKEEKLRFCQDLIKQAANLKKPSGMGKARSKSKSGKRRISTGDAMSKKTKHPTSTHGGRSKSSIRSSALQPSHKSKSDLIHYDSYPSEHSPMKSKSKRSSSRSHSKTGNDCLKRFK